MTAHVVGESGVGKSAISQHLLEWARRTSGAVVVRGRCYAQESLPYKALDGIVDELSRYLLGLDDARAAALLPRNVPDLVRLFPVLRRVPAIAAARRRAIDERGAAEIKRNGFMALRELLARMAAERPLIVLIDDVQWGDAESAAVVDLLLSPPDPPPLLLLLSYRSDEARASGFLRELRALGDRYPTAPPEVRVELRPLPAEAARALVERLGEGRLRPAVIEQIVADAAGNPLLLEQLAAFSGDLGRRPISGSFAAGAEAASDSDDGKRELMADMVEERLADLPEAWQRAMALLALSARPLAAEVLREAAGLDVLDQSVLTRLAASNLARVETGDGTHRLAPYHDRVRDALLARLRPEERPRLHARLGEALVREGIAAPRVLRDHFREAGLPARAARFALLAAEESEAALAFEDAAQLYEHTLAWHDGDEASRRRVRRRLADALANGGHCLAAARHYAELAREAEGLAAVDLERRAFELYYTGGMRDEAMALLGRLAADVDVPQLCDSRGARLGIAWDLLRLRARGLRYRARAAAEIDPAGLARIDACYSASRTMLRRDSLLQIRGATRGLLLALDAGEEERIAEGLSQVGAVAAMVKPGSGRAMHAAAGAIVAKLDLPRLRGIHLLWTAMAHLSDGAWSEALAAVDVAIAVFRESTEVTTWMQQAQLLSLITVQQLGRFGELRRRSHEALAFARATGNRYVEEYALILLAVLRLMDDDAAGARERWTTALERFPRGDTTRMGVWLWICASHLYEGDLAGAEACFRRATDDMDAFDLPKHPLYRATRLFMQAALQVQAAVERGADARALAQAERDVERLARVPLPSARAQALLLRAGLLAVRGRTGDAARTCREAAGAFENAGLGSSAHAARRRLGELVGGADGARAIEQADTAMRADGIAEPDRWTRARAPGFPTERARRGAP